MTGAVLSLSRGRPVAGHPLWHFGLVALAGVVAFVSIKAVERWKRSGRVLVKPTPALIGLALFGLGSSVIHGLVCGEHFKEWILYGLFFLGASTVQAAWSILILVRPSQRLLILGAAGNAAVVALYFVSRTSGIPFGPDAFQPEAFDRLGLGATGCELAVLLGACWLLLARRATQHPGRATRSAPIRSGRVAAATHA